MSEEKYRILVVDDEESMREILSIMLHREGYQVDVAFDGAQAVSRLKSQSYDLVISDVKMPRLNGFELLAHIKERVPETVVIMITAFSSSPEAVEAMKNGAYDYITKPFKNEEIRLVVRNALERKVLREQQAGEEPITGGGEGFAGLIGKSKAMQEMYALIEKVAGSRVNVLITGESGTGKELVARAVHYTSDRRGGSFVPINCGAIPENLLESELFGHEKGSFTGAYQQKQGLFELADGGTIFLDEVGELPPLMQVKLLRVLEEREFRRVGGTRNIRVDVRVIAATNKELEADVERGGFREDLFYRLNVIRMLLPSLRERKEDIPLLVNHFVQKFTGGSETSLSEEALRHMMDYHWPGNVRELENAVERCIVLGSSKEISVDCLPRPIQTEGVPQGGAVLEIPDTGLDIDAYLGEVEKDILLKALEKTGGVRKKAAELLGISFRSIRYRLSKFGLSPDEDEASSGAQ